MKIEIPDSLLKRMQSCAIPLVDTHISVLEKWADFYEEHNKLADRAVAPSNGHESSSYERDLPKLDAFRPPDLTHTVVKGHFGGTAFDKWNDLVRLAHSKTFTKVGSYEGLKSVSRAQLKHGEFTEEGYRYLPEIDVSIQGVDANRAWDHSLRLAKYLHVELWAEVEWREKNGAARPGQQGLLHYRP
jgi:hypothetical protein